MRTGLTVAAVVLVLDQLTKWLILAWVQPVPPIEVTGFFNIVLVWNEGVSFGMLQGLGDHGLWVIGGFAVVICAVLLVWLARETRPLTRFALGLVLGGAIGNLIDRVRFGAVVDFLDFHAFGYHWPAFNVSDSAIVIGAALLVVDGLRPDRKAAAGLRGQTS